MRNSDRFLLIGRFSVLDVLRNRALADSVPKCNGLIGSSTLRKAVRSGVSVETLGKSGPKDIPSCVPLPSMSAIPLNPMFRGNIFCVGRQTSRYTKYPALTSVVPLPSISRTTPILRSSTGPLNCHRAVEVSDSVFIS